MNVAIIEDEVYVGRTLASNIKELRPEWTVQMIPGSIEESIKWFKSHPMPDLLFLDIELSDGISFSLLEQHHIDSFIIFTTAYDEYAIRAFSVNSIDYLLKPIDKPDLLTAIEKFERISDKYRKICSDNLYADGVLDSLSTIKQSYRSRFMVPQKDSYSVVLVENIAYFYAKDKYCTLITIYDERYLLSQSLDQIEEQLDPKIFFRANRQVLFNINAIQKITPYFNGKLAVDLKPNSGEKITVSKDKASHFKRWLNS